MSFVRADYKERAAAWRKRDHEERVERQLKRFFNPQFIKKSRAEAERQLRAFRPEYLEKVSRREAEIDPALTAELDADLARFLALDPEDQLREAERPADVEAELAVDLEKFMQERGSFEAAVELLRGAWRRDADGMRAQAREEARRELEQERRALESEKAEAARSEGIGEITLDFRRGKDGKISSPVRLSGSAGEYDLGFERGKDGRIATATVRPAVK